MHIKKENNMFGKLLLVFTIVPLVELYILILIGEKIGALTTILIIFVTALFGAYLVKREGLSVFAGIKRTIGEKRIPGNELLHVLLVILGGFALITPGVITDILGITMLLPGTRQIYARKILQLIKKKN